MCICNCNVRTQPALIQQQRAIRSQQQQQLAATARHSNNINSTVIGIIKIIIISSCQLCTLHPIDCDRIWFEYETATSDDGSNVIFANFEMLRREYNQNNRQYLGRYFIKCFLQIRLTTVPSHTICRAHAFWLSDTNAFDNYNTELGARKTRVRTNVNTHCAHTYIHMWIRNHAHTYIHMPWNIHYREETCACACFCVNRLEPRSDATHLQRRRTLHNNRTMRMRVFCGFRNEKALIHSGK